MTEGVVQLYVRDLLGVNSDVTMHIISSLSSMDETNRLFAISGCGGNSSFGRTAQIELYCSNYYTHTLLLFYLLFPTYVLHSYR